MKQIEVSNMLNNIMNKQAYQGTNYVYGTDPDTEKIIIIPGKNKIRIDVRDKMSKYYKETSISTQGQLDEIINHIYGPYYFKDITSRAADFSGNKVSFKNTIPSRGSMP